MNPEEFLGDNDLLDKPDDNDLDAIRQDNYSLTRKFYVIDGHRPWNLDNLFGSAMVICFDNGYVDGNLQNEKDAYKILVEMGDEDDDSDSDSEREDTDVDEENEQASEARMLRKQTRSSNEDKIQAYYNQSSSVVSACSISVYGLVSAIGEINLENLWLAIIGSSGHDCSIFVDEVRRLSEESGITLKRLYIFHYCDIHHYTRHYYTIG